MKELILIVIIFLSGCAVNNKINNDISMKFTTKEKVFTKHTNCVLRNDLMWISLPDKIDIWQYRIYGSHIQNCYEKIIEK